MTDLSTEARVARGAAFLVVILLGVTMFSRSWATANVQTTAVSIGPLGGRACATGVPGERCADVPLSEVGIPALGALVIAGAALASLNLIAVALLISKRRRVNVPLATVASLVGACPAVYFVYAARRFALDIPGMVALGGFALAAIVPFAVLRTAQTDAPS